MFTCRRLSVIPLAVSAIALIAPATNGTGAPTTADAIAAIEAYAPRALAEQGAPGMSVTITDRSRTLTILTYGYSNAEAKTPVTAQTRFFVYSITKSFTALALLRQYDAGRLDLQAPVQRYLPWFRVNSGGTPILIHQLLSHTSGLPTFYGPSGGTFGVAELRRTHVLFPPGTAWSYANLGFYTLGDVLAALMGVPWQDAVTASVLVPIGMAHTAAYVTPASFEDTAYGYTFREYDQAMPPKNAPLLISSFNNDYLDPAGSIVSSPEDMARYMRFYLNGGKTESGVQLIAPATFAAMTSPDRYNNGKPTGAKSDQMPEWPNFYARYGYGIAIQDAGGDHLIGHTGGGGGYTACMQMNLTRGFGVIAMSNLSEEPLHPCAIVRYAMSVLRAQSLGEALPAQPSPPPDPAVVANAADYVGAFTNASSALSVAATGQRLSLVDRGETYAMLRSGTDSFWTDDPRLPTFYLVFRRNAAKAVDELSYGPTLYFGARYAGPRTFSHPATYDRLVGRYESNGGDVERVFLVKGKLTFNGAPLTARSDGTFVTGNQVLRFDMLAAGQMQRVWINDADLYRVYLP